MKLIKSVLFVSIFLLAFFLRAQEVLFNNYLFLIDMGRDMLAVKSIVFDHHLTLIGPYTSLAGVFQGPFYYYLISIPTLISNGDPIGPLILMLAISLSTALLAFYYLKKHFGIIPAFIGFFIFAISPEAIAAATYTWNPHPMWLLIMVFIFLMHEFLLKRDKMQIYIWPVIGLMFHFEAALGFFILLTTFIYLLTTRKKSLFTINFLIGILLLFITFLPQILFELRHDFLMTRSVIDMASGNNQSLAVEGESNNFIWVMQNHANALFANYLTTLPKILFSTPIQILVFFGSIIAFYRVRNDKKLKNYSIYFSFYFSFLAIFIALTCFYLFPLRYWFLTGFQTFYIIATTLTLSFIFKYRVGKIALLVLLLLTLPHILNRFDTLYLNPPDDGGFAKVKGKLAAIDYIYNDAENNNFGLLVFTPPVYTDAYDYLIWWQAKERGRTIPTQEKKGTFYLLMEPDPANPSSYNGWLETVVKTGKVINTKTLQSGIIIQKRVE